MMISRKMIFGAMALLGSAGASAAAQAPSIPEIVTYVRRAGWPVDLNYLCPALEIAIGPRCLFLQVAVHRQENATEDHGFNVPADSRAPAQIVLYRVSPLTGEFFLATADGKLLKALQRSRSTAFETMPPEQAASAYQKELEFWQANLGRMPDGTAR